MKLRNTTAQICCIMLWYAERKQVDKMESKMISYAIIDTRKHQLCVMRNMLDVKHRVNR